MLVYSQGKLKSIHTDTDKTSHASIIHGSQKVDTTEIPKAVKCGRFKRSIIQS